MKRPPVKLFSLQWWMNRVVLALVTTAVFEAAKSAGLLPAALAAVAVGVLFLIWMEGL